MNLSFHRTQQASVWVQPFLGSSFSCSALAESWRYHWGWWWSPADEAHLWLPSYLHTRPCLCRGQCRGGAQRPAQAMSGACQCPQKHFSQSQPLETLCSLCRVDSKARRIRQSTNLQMQTSQPSRLILFVVHPDCSLPLGGRQQLTLFFPCREL